jgi:nucleoside-diphosphate-sugar epimerase
MTKKVLFYRISWVLVDILLVNLATFLAYMIRGLLYSDNQWKSLMLKEYADMFWLILIVVTFVRIGMFFIFKLYKPVWRYASVGEFINIVKAVTLGSVLFIVAMFISRQIFYSRGVVAIDWALNLIFIGMTKFASRIFNEYWRFSSRGPETRVLIFGAGSSGQSALREMRENKEKHYRSVGFIDDDPEKVGKSIQGVDVLGTSENIAEIIRKSSAKEVLIAVNSITESKLKELSDLSNASGAKVSVLREIRSLSSPGDIPEKILVIGGAGYVGSVMVRKMLQKGYKVKVLDSLIYGGQPLTDLYNNPDFELIVGDFRHVETIVHAARGVDAIVHLGAIVGDSACQLDPEFALEINSIATKMIKSVCAGFGIKRFLFASTCSVYGASDGMLDENSELNPLSVYARSKVYSEKALLEGNGNLSPTVFRMATVFGLSYRPRFDLVINLLTAKAVAGEMISIFGGNQWRPFVHVNDVAKAFIKCLESPLDKVAHQIFNVGDDSLNYQISDIGKLISEIITGSNIEHRENLADQRNYRVSFDKIRNTLDYKCDKTIKDGIIEIRDAIQSGKIIDYRDALFSNTLWLEKRQEKREILFSNSHYE